MKLILHNLHFIFSHKFLFLRIKTRPIAVSDLLRDGRVYVRSYVETKNHMVPCFILVVVSNSKICFNIYIASHNQRIFLNIEKSHGHVQNIKRDSFTIFYIYTLNLFYYWIDLKGTWI